MILPSSPIRAIPRTSPSFIVLQSLSTSPSASRPLHGLDVAIASCRVFLDNILGARAGDRGGPDPRKKKGGQAVAMDLRTIMNTDGGAASKAPQASQSSGAPSDPSRQQQPQQQQQYAEFSSRPSQPLQHAQHPQHASPGRSSSFGPAQSPYQQFPQDHRRH